MSRMNNCYFFVNLENSLCIFPFIQRLTIYIYPIFLISRFLVIDIATNFLAAIILGT